MESAHFNPSNYIYNTEKRHSLIGTLKYFYLLDYDIYFQDNYLLDSGFLRAIYQYKDDNSIKKTSK